MMVASTSEGGGKKSFNASVRLMFLALMVSPAIYCVVLYLLQMKADPSEPSQEIGEMLPAIMILMLVGLFSELVFIYFLWIPLFQTATNLDMMAKFISIKACLTMTSERAITGALPSGI